MKSLFTLAFTFCSLLTIAQTKIPIDSVSNHKGDLVTVCGKVYGIKFLEKSQITFIDLGAAYPDAPLTIVIFEEARAKFPQTPEKIFADKQVCVTGTIAERNGKLQIVVNDPKEIVLQ